MDLTLDRRHEPFKDRDGRRQKQLDSKVMRNSDNNSTIASDDGLYTVQYTESDINDDLAETQLNDSKMIVMEHLYLQVSLRLDVYCKVSSGGLYECLHCPEICPSIEEFKKHYKDKHLETFYDCTKCGFSTLCQGTMSDHVSRYHDNDASLVKRKLIRKISSGQDGLQSSVHDTFVNQSGKRTLTNSITGNNSNGHQAGKNDSSETGKQELTRNQMDRAKESEFDSDIDKMDHEESDASDSEGRNNESRHECKVCLQRFTRSERVREHYDAIHLNMVYICCICGYTNRWKRSVIQHLRSKHEKIPPYKHLMIKKRVDTLDLSNKQAINVGDLKTHNQRNDDTTPTVSSFADDDDDDEIRERKMVAVEEERHFDSDLQDDIEDFEPEDYDEGLDAGSDHELDLSRNSIAQQNKLLYKSKHGSTDYSPNCQSQQHLETLWACRICGFSHKWPLIMTNHLRILHKLQPPFDQYILETKGDSVSRMLDTFSSKQLLSSSNNHRSGYLKDILDLSTSHYNQSNERSRNHFDFSLHSLSKSTQLATKSPVLQNYLCKLCDKSFDTLRGLKEHTEGMHTDLVWACKLCSFTDKWRSQAISHLRNSHNCQPPYNDHLTRRSASLASGPISRPASSEDSGSRLDLPSTSSSFSEHPSFELPSGLRNSKESKINSKECYTKLANDQYQCTKCTKTCGSAQGITEHFEAFHLNMLYYCQLCDFTDVWRSMMTKHLRQKHQLGKPYDEYLKRVKLDADAKLVSDSPLMDAFRRRSHPLKISQTPPDVSPSLILSSQRSTPSVSTHNNNGGILNRISKGAMSNGRSIIGNSQNGNVQNNVSQEPRGTPKMQSSHNKDSSMGKQYIHLDNQLKCKLCGSVFTSLQGFQEHYEAIHLDVIWTCRKCPTSFRWRQQLTKHLKLIHECEPPFNEYMLKEAGSHKLKKPIPEKSPHGAYSRRPILPREDGNSIDNTQSMEGDLESSPSPVKEQETTANESHDLAQPEDLSMTDKTTPVSTPVTTPSVMKNYTYLNNQFLCKLCSANFTSLQGFQEHYEAVHLNIVFVCKLCGFVNRWRPQVTSHLKRNHAVDPPYADYLIKQPSSNKCDSKDEQAKIDDEMEVDDVELDPEQNHYDHELERDYESAQDGEADHFDNDPETEPELMNDFKEEDHDERDDDDEEDYGYREGDHIKEEEEDEDV